LPVLPDSLSVDGLRPLRGARTFQPARLMDAEGVKEAVAKAIDDYVPTRPALDRLLHLLFTHRPESLRALESDGRLTLDRLRKDDATLPGPSSGSA
jgi:hypothetical protein